MYENQSEAMQKYLIELMSEDFFNLLEILYDYRADSTNTADKNSATNILRETYKGEDHDN